MKNEIKVLVNAGGESIGAVITTKDSVKLLSCVYTEDVEEGVEFYLARGGELSISGGWWDHPTPLEKELIKKAL